MIIVRNKCLPVRNFQAINLFGILFVRRECYPLSVTTINHERIHTRQIRELLFVPFYLIYIAEWLARSFRHRSFRKGYFTTSFEQEAYGHEHDLHYLKHRKAFAFLKYLCKGWG